MTERRHIFLIGFSGSGKTTIGRLLASKLKYRFVDLDKVIEEHARSSISGIFRKKGEQCFRRMEVSELRDTIKSQSSLVVALGGGAFQTASVREMAGRSGVTVFLGCSQRELHRRLRKAGDRPLLEADARAGETPVQTKKRRVKELLKKRLANYRSADLILSTTNRTTAQSVSQLIRLLKTAK